MKTLTLFLLLLFPLAAIAAPPSYSGAWVLDVPASASMPEPFRQGIKEWRLDVAQSPDELKVAIHITRDGMEPLDEVHTHKLDGTPVKFETEMRTPDGPVKVPMTSVAQVDEDGAIGIFIEGEMSAASRRIRRATKERWELSEDGQTLTVHREEVMRGGPAAFDMVFRRAAQ